jgi:hypothetical protein
MNNIVQFNQPIIMNYNFTHLLLNIFKLKKSLLLAFTLTCINATHSQMNINGSFSIFGEMGVFGNLQLSTDAQVFFQNGSTLHMLGTATSINSGADIFANTSSTQAGTGRILFGGAAAQTLDGGNSSAIGGTQPSLINVAINNTDNLTLTNTNTRITSGLDFINGHVILGSNGLELSSAASASNANGTRYVVTNGTGFMVKEGFSSAFSFPVGRATSDYTPATVTPSATDDFFVQVKNYSESASDEFVTTDGVNRTWNIYSTGGAGANIALQHNSTTNGSNYTTNGGDLSAFVTQYQGLQSGRGTWELGTGAQGTNVSGSVSGSVVHNRVYSPTALTSSANGAFFSKSTLPLTPLPIALLDFYAKKRDENQALLSWSTTTEYNSSHFEVETSTNGQNWSKIGEVKAQGVSYDLTNYQLVHTNPALGINYYRLNLVDIDGSGEYSNIQSVHFENSISTLAKVTVFPNPSNGILNISSLNKSFGYTLTDLQGKILYSFNNKSENNNIELDLSKYENGVYFIKVNSLNGDAKTFKIVLNK